MEMVEVHSSRIQAIGYDEERKELEIEFNDGSKYIYDDVPREVHEGLMSAGSVGRYFERYVKGVFKFYKQ